MTTVENIPLVGGSLCLDFVNTTGARASGGPRERLTCYSDLVTWSERAGILDVKWATRLRREAIARKEHAAGALRDVHRIREDLYDLLSAFVDRRRLSPQALARVTQHWRRARRTEELVLEGSRLNIRTLLDRTDLTGPISPIIRSAVELLTSDRLALMKRCAECDWLYLDTSKNGKRRWCKSTCGNRARSRERYERQQRSRR